MNTKEAIKFLNKTKIYADADEDEDMDNFIEVDKLNKTIELLKRGEKFENLFNEVEESFQNDLDLAEWVDDIKQKYFPKPVKDKDYFYEATSKDPRLKKIPFKKGGS